MSRWRRAKLWLATVIVTVVLTSAFWIAWYHRAPGSVASAPPVAAATIQPLADEPPPGGMIVPVRGIGRSQLVDTFTQARASGARAHDAIDIPAAAGTPVIAAAPGTVEKLFLSRDGGNTIYIRSDERRWSHYYAHLAGYAAGLHEGQHVTRGAVIGAVGSTGNADPASPHLHFAVHAMAPDEPWYRGRPVNPYPLLAAR